MCISPARTEFRRDPDGFHDLLRRGPCAASALHMSFDTLRTLRDVGNGNGNQLFRTLVESALGEYCLRQCFEGVGLRGRKLPSSLRVGGGSLWVMDLTHTPPVSCSGTCAATIEWLPESRFWPRRGALFQLHGP